MAWPICIAPLPGEITSSWLARAARAYGESPRGLTRLILGKVPVWTRDLDVTLDEASLAVLGACLGTMTGGHARITSLRPFIERLGGFSPLTHGILRIGVYHRTRRLHGQQYCPRCLEEDGEPYYRRNWRLAFAIACLRHDRMLRDGCPSCGGPLAAHRSPGLDVRRCAHCGKSLVCDDYPADTRLLRLQTALWRNWEAGCVSVGAITVTFQEWLAGARVLCRAVVRARARNGLVAEVECATGVSMPMPQHPGIFEASRTPDRAAMLVAANCLTDDWPRSFLNLSSRLGLSVTDFVDPKRARPVAWLGDVLKRLPYHPRVRIGGKRRTRAFWRRSVDDARKDIEMSDAVRARLDSIRARRPS